MNFPLDKFFLTGQGLLMCFGLRNVQTGAELRSRSILCVSRDGLALVVVECTSPALDEERVEGVEARRRLVQQVVGVEGHGMGDGVGFGEELEQVGVAEEVWKRCQLARPARVRRGGRRPRASSRASACRIAAPKAAVGLKWPGTALKGSVSMAERPRAAAL